MLLFDLDGTLLHLDGTYETVLREAFGWRFEEETLDRAVETYDFLGRFRDFEANSGRRWPASHGRRGPDVEGARAAGFEAVHAPDGVASVRDELRDLL